jgi:hypothetical protein
VGAARNHIDAADEREWKVVDVCGGIYASAHDARAGYRTLLERITMWLLWCSGRCDNKRCRRASSTRCAVYRHSEQGLMPPAARTLIVRQPNPPTIYQSIGRVTHGFHGDQLHRLGNPVKPQFLLFATAPLR